ncbi:MAG TPA: C40 family peptidase [Mycobacteriales bacterium]|nr:C40 family peptidase [Mycobacteriales bacterium]
MTSTSRAAIAVGVLTVAGLLAGTAATATPDRALGIPLPAAAVGTPSPAPAPTASVTPRANDDAGRSAHRKPLASRHERAAKADRKHARHGHHGKGHHRGKAHGGGKAHHRGTQSHHGDVPDGFGARARLVLKVAKAQRGKPYVWGAAGPRSFDCSGYVQWVYRHATGRKLPKYTDTQWAVLKHINRRQLRPGDLVFVGAGRHKSHVGIYAGHWRWWVAPHTGSHVKKQRIWAAPHTYARVLREPRR